MKKPTLCRLPAPIEDPREAELYRRLHRAHCDRKDASHECVGRLTIDRNGITLNCKLCGDVRKTYGEAS